ncbi:hypothetical protein CO112_00275 [Candidatus Dojkabacteria bacterium CG_4_9_14_3_um_filter_150_Dojkabacteria_WS6_41_13]|uniref:Uncharacterized protein n=1 Tax=Candidatus Dojkabacteria bacterium CG_4_10_14_0_2_um_filter_Dojkabacteria_WS6_41_15 TaxID=2014249 RepID=A0A2M7W2B5_9BACT|nr:MAG: hypothetical protein COZ14_04985 [Candidatus Dojkabacteria bacterium CG_4_10_14_3_um_filter_Dojkabacteria_WS6_41_9]PJA14475.1 MAG: hypothetical protein COX64_01985 [Candidatus Dojkabacteria bacterium CG_4_10_14_0_2_um_filter_Dojkabacteria_WS6_41_15]PJB23928.1 MAG: hypothetical protein CO112_00275 [Candidatus Dojkabacteria bacterium CG_4_9_14_3_um_filter_150_Dojkabacteria_WS6_41_13]
MKRRNVLLIVVGVACIAVPIMWSSRSHAAKPTDSATPVPTVVLGATATPTPEDTEETEQTEIAVKITCDSAKSELQRLATDFMELHQQKKAEDALLFIAAPYTQEEQDQLDYWLGLDNENTYRLYQTPATNYSLSAFSLGKIMDRGFDSNERGSKRCQIPVTETRSVTITIPYSEVKATRYLDFAVDASGIVKLTAYRESKEGGKYGGFN